MVIKKHTFENGYSVIIEKGNFDTYYGQAPYMILVSKNRALAETIYCHSLTTLLEQIFQLQSRTKVQPTFA